MPYNLWIGGSSGGSKSLITAEGLVVGIPLEIYSMVFE